MKNDAAINDRNILARCPSCGIEFNSKDLVGKHNCPVCGRQIGPGRAFASGQKVGNDNATAFVNQANGHIEKIDGAWAWVLLFGCIYFAAKGVWTHAVAGLFLAIVTGGISWFIYPFFAKRIMREHYLREGWQPA